MAKAKRTELSARKAQLLHQTVANYIDTAEPVGSKRLSETSGLSVSSATIRNDLNELEREGYLTQVHMSSGRVPTDKGYRAYVNELITATSGKRADELSHDLSLIGHNVQQVLNQVTDLMGNLVDYTTIVMTPDIYQETLKVAHLVLVELDVVMVVLMNSVGLNTEFLVRLQDRVDQETLNRISQLLTVKLNGVPILQLTDELIATIQGELPTASHVVGQVLDEIKRLKQYQTNSDKLMMRGVSNMIKLPEFRNMELTQKVLSTLEETRVMVSLFSEYMSVDRSTVLIGEEQKLSGLVDCSMVVAPYQIGTEPAGMIGVLGPKRMAYEKVIPMVESIVNKINDYLSGPIVR